GHPGTAAGHDRLPQPDADVLDAVADRPGPAPDRTGGNAAMNVAHPPPAGRFRWLPGQALARVGRLARKELSEILRDRRTIITLVLMPLLLYPLLSFAFRQFLPAMVPTKETDRPLTIGVATAPRRLAGET